MVVLGLRYRRSGGLDPLGSQVCWDMGVSCLGGGVVLVVEWKVMVSCETWGGGSVAELRSGSAEGFEMFGDEWPGFAIISFLLLSCLPVPFGLQMGLISGRYVWENQFAG